MFASASNSALDVLVIKSIASFLASLSSNKILFIEEVNESLYKIDRMLTQLMLNGVFDKIKGLLVGKFSSDEKDFDEKVIKLLKNYDIPCGYGFSASHEKNKTTLPLNVKYEINFTNGNMDIRENYLA